MKKMQKVNELIILQLNLYQNNIIQLFSQESQKIKNKSCMFRQHRGLEKTQG